MVSCALRSCSSSKRMDKKELTGVTFYRQRTREKSKLSTNIKLNVQGEKCAWFRDNLDPEWTICNAASLNQLIKTYLSRFDEELEQIKIKHSIGNRKNRQHASREDIIKMTIKREFDDFNTCGTELPNLFDPVQFNMLKSWNGELRFLQNFKFKMFSKKVLEEEEKKQQKSIAVNDSKTNKTSPTKNITDNMEVENTE